MLTILLSLFSIGCANMPKKHIHSHDWRKATHEVVAEYYPAVSSKLKPYFEQSGVRYPPNHLALLAFKKERKIELWAKSKQKWQFIKNYPLTAFSGGLGPKLHDHDRQIPEGIYHITELNPFSLLQLSMKIDYPNVFDLEHADQDGRSHLGDNIYIHGKALSVGCLALGDDAIDELFVLVAVVGKKNTQVIIAPNDLRRKKALIAKRPSPQWLPELYASIHRALQPYTTVPWR